MAIPLLDLFPGGIVYGNTTFSEPTWFPSFFTSSHPGIYAILVYDSDSSPRPFRLLYIGESESLSQRLTKHHEKYQDWVREAKGAALYCACHLASNLTSQQRKNLECALINQFRPPCNEKLSLFASLF